jgi:hypothetical protein
MSHGARRVGFGGCLERHAGFLVSKGMQQSGSLRDPLLGRRAARGGKTHRAEASKRLMPGVVLLRKRECSGQNQQHQPHTILLIPKREREQIPGAVL